MKLTAKEMRDLLPLLKPDVEIEIVLHGHQAETLAPVQKPRRVAKGKNAEPWTPERRAAHGLIVRAGKARIAADAAAPAVKATGWQRASQDPKPIKVEPFGASRTPDQIQTDWLREEMLKVQAKRQDGGSK